MKKIKDILNRKGYDFFFIPPSTSVIEALEIMDKKNIGSVLVMDKNEYLGIVTERDYARKVILKGKKSTEILVSEIMSIHLPRITQETTIEQAMELMGEYNIRYLPVFEQNAICGIISINDIVKEIILKQEEAISQLREYMQGN
jgi:CBS domain-containing protein